MTAVSVLCRRFFQTRRVAGAGATPGHLDLAHPRRSQMSDILVKIPLSRLQPSAENVRKTEKGAEISALAASIDAHGLLQNLTVKPIASANGREKCYEVVAGGRRLQALKLLAKRKRIPKNFTVPCKLLKRGDSRNVEVSLAENVVRTALHPADQFEAFSQLNAQGLGAADIAARFGVTQTVVEQRLKLAAVSPRLMAVYREGGMTLEQLSAFTISDDHAVQEHVWFDAPLFDRSAPAIRRALTKALVEGSDRRARFVGAKAYEAAGGIGLRDLFEQDAAYFTDGRLLDGLVAEKLQAEADKVKKEGWNWVEERIELDYEEIGRFGRVAPKQIKLPGKEQKKLDALCERHDALVSELDEQPDEKAVAELDRISEEIEALSLKREQWSKKAKARAGAIVSLDPRGALRVTRGLVRVEAGERPARRKSKEAPEEVTSKENANSYSESLLRDLSAHRTAALRETLAARPDVALTALLHALTLDTFFAADAKCIDIRPVFVDLAPCAEGIEESPAVAAMADRHKWSVERLPEPEHLWSWLAAQAIETKLELLAYLAARTVNAVQQRRGFDAGERLVQADLLAQEASLDMSKWWRPTRASYFDRVSEARIVEAVSEAVSTAAAQNIAAMKKPAMASRAEELVKDAG